MKKSFLGMLFYAAVLLFSLTACRQEQAPHLLIIHTNDTHSQIDPAPDNDKYTPGAGGVIQRAAILEAMRETDPTLLYLDGGDMVQGSPYFNIYKGELEIKAMNAQRLSAATFGNHEFDNGIDFLVNMAKQAEFQYICSNYDCCGTALEPYVKESMILRNNGIKIGLLGITCDPKGMIFRKNYNGITYIDPAEAVNRVAAGLKSQGCDLVILLSHEGYNDTDDWGDRRIARATRNVDLIIGGHSHTNIEHGYEALNADSLPVMITQTGGKINPMGAIDIQMQANTDPESSSRWMVKSITCYKLHPDSLDLAGRGEKMAELVAPYREQLTAKMQNKIGYAPESMDKDRPQSLLGNFTADALRHMGSKVLGKPVAVGIMNNGGLRATINRGDVTLGDLYKVYPFENTLDLIELKGEYLSDLIQSLAGKGLEALSGCQVTLTTDANGKTTASKILVDGKPIQPDKKYWIATIDYLADGNGGMGALLKGEQNNTGILLRDMMIEYVQELTAQGKTVSSQLDDRAVWIK